MSAQLDTLTTEVAETATVIDSAIVLIKGIKAKLDAAGTDPAKLAEPLWKILPPSKIHLHKTEATSPRSSLPRPAARPPQQSPPAWFAA